MLQQVLFSTLPTQICIFILRWISLWHSLAWMSKLWLDSPYPISLNLLFFGLSQRAITFLFFSKMHFFPDAEFSSYAYYSFYYCLHQCYCCFASRLIVLLECLGRLEDGQIGRKVAWLFPFYASLIPWPMNVYYNLLVLRPGAETGSYFSCFFAVFVRW